MLIQNARTKRTINTDYIGFYYCWEWENEGWNDGDVHWLVKAILMPGLDDCIIAAYNNKEDALDLIDNIINCITSGSSLLVIDNECDIGGYHERKTII